MSAAAQRDSRSDSQARRRLALFALVSVALHAAFLVAVQTGAWRGTDAAPAPEPLPVQIVELTPPEPEPEPPLPDIPEELPPEPPQEIPPAPEPEPEPAPQPEIPNEPEPEPDIPREPAETPDIPAPEPTPPAPPAPPAAAAPVVAPEPEQAPEPEPEDDEPEDGASLVVPGLTYRSGSDSPLVRFGHVVECASLNRRYDDDCADVGPIYLTEREIQTLMPGGRLAPEIENYFRSQMAAETERDRRIARDSNTALPNPNVCGTFDRSACVPDGYGNLLQNPAVRRALDEAGLD